MIIWFVNIALAYHRHVGKPMFWVNGKESKPDSNSEFLSIVRVALSAAGLKPVTKKIVRKIVGDLG